MPPPKRWTVFAYVKANGKLVTDDWDADETLTARLAFEATLKNSVKVTDYKDWPGYRHPLKGAAGKAGIFEVEFRADRRQWRILCKVVGERCVVVLCICYHKGAVWTPAGAVDTALRRTKLLEGKESRANVVEVRHDL